MGARGIVDKKVTAKAVQSTMNSKVKKLKKDVEEIKRMMKEGEVSKITWHTGKERLTNSMTKRGTLAQNLLQLFQKSVGYKT